MHHDDMQLSIIIEIAMPQMAKVAKPGRSPVMKHPAKGWRHSEKHVPLDGFTPPTITIVDRKPAAGVNVILPNGDIVPTHAANRVLHSPMNNLFPVDEGRRIGSSYRQPLQQPVAAETAFASLGISLALRLGYASTFDFQRSGNFISGYRHYREYADVSHFNIGLLCQQAGLPLTETLTIAGGFAIVLSSNSDPNDKYGFDPWQSKFMELGFAAGEYAGFPQPAVAP